MLMSSSKKITIGKWYKNSLSTCKIVNKIVIKKLPEIKNRF